MVGGVHQLILVSCGAAGACTLVCAFADFTRSVGGPGWRSWDAVGVIALTMRGIIHGVGDPGGNSSRGHSLLADTADRSGKVVSSGAEGLLGGGFLVVAGGLQGHLEVFAHGGVIGEARQGRVCGTAREIVARQNLLLARRCLLFVCKGGDRSVTLVARLNYEQVNGTR